MPAPVLPGSTIGILGSGQLGRMLAIAARQLGYRVHVYSPEADSPAGQIADVEAVGDYDDADAVAQFAQGVDVLTFEFENIPAASAAAAQQHVLVRPEPRILHVTQHRLREKLWLQDHGFPVAAFRALSSVEELQAAVQELGCPCVLKTAGFGYDGKGQRRIHEPGDAEQAWETLFSGGAGRHAVSGASPGRGEDSGQDRPPHQESEPLAVLEEWVSFELECSVVGGRGAGGEVELFAVSENIHHNHILDLSLVPARMGETAELRAQALARGVLEAMDVVGVMAVEMFYTHRGELLINELAPRVHNSGHWTIEGAVTSQFEQQVRAVCGLPLGSPEQQQSAALANLLGDLWFDEGGQPSEPDWPALLNYPDVKLHLYGKREPRPGRKMGHLTALGGTAELALQEVATARAAL